MASPIHAECELPWTTSADMELEKKVVRVTKPFSQTSKPLEGGGKRSKERKKLTM